MKTHRIITLLLVTVHNFCVAQNIFLECEYWQEKPSLDLVKADIKKGNDPTELNAFSFDAISWAFIEKVDTEVIKYLLTIPGNDVNKRTHDGRTYIFWAAYKGNLPMMKYLVEKGAKTDVIDSHGYSLMNFAAVTGQLDIALYDFCIANGAKPQTEVDLEGANVLLLVAPHIKDLSLIDYFTEKGISIHGTDTEGNGIFNYAAKKGNINLLKALIAKGSDYKSLTKKGNNAFISASKGTHRHKNDIRVFKYLDSIGLEANITNADGHNPLHAVSWSTKHKEVVQFFIDKGVAVNAKDNQGNTPFHNAVQWNTDLEIVKLFTSSNIDINIKNSKEETGLMKALQGNTAEVVSFLLGKNASFNLKDKKGNTEVGHLFASLKTRKAKLFTDKFDLIKKAGIDFTIPQEDGNTVWHLAVKAGDIEIIKKISDLEVSVNTLNADGISPLHLAAMKSKNPKMIAMLISQGANIEQKTNLKETAYDLAKENELLQDKDLAYSLLQ